MKKFSGFLIGLVLSGAMSVAHSVPLNVYILGPDVFPKRRTLELDGSKNIPVQIKAFYNELVSKVGVSALFNEYPDGVEFVANFTFCGELVLYFPEIEIVFIPGENSISHLIRFPVLRAAEEFSTAEEQVAYVDVMAHETAVQLLIKKKENTDNGAGIGTSNGAGIGISNDAGIGIGTSTP